MTETSPRRREPTRRLTLDIPERLHYALKMRSVVTNTPMVDAIVGVLIEAFADDLERYQR